MEVRLEQYWKVLSPIEVKPSGRVMEVRPEQPLYLQLVVCQLILAEMVEK